MLGFFFGVLLHMNTEAFIIKLKSALGVNDLQELCEKEKRKRSCERRI